MAHFLFCRIYFVRNSVRNAVRFAGFFRESQPMLTPRVVPISEFRKNLAFFRGLVASNGQPVVVARHRRQDVMLVRRDEWERLTGRQSLWRSIGRG
jgi:hypothetical protein